MRQVGVISAAAVYALEHHRERLAEDHVNARRLAEALNGYNGIDIDLATVQTNIVMMDIVKTKLSVAAAIERLQEAGVRVVAFSASTLRAVTHLDVSAGDIDDAIGVFRRIFT
jgi:threonine aldolase